jgi:hypothetical protein
MLRTITVASLIALVAAASPRLAWAHGNYTGWADFLIDWLPFLVVVVGLGVYGMVKATHRKALVDDPAAPDTAAEQVTAEKQRD